MEYLALIQIESASYRLEGGGWIGKYKEIHKNIQETKGNMRKISWVWKIEIKAGKINHGKVRKFMVLAMEVDPKSVIA